MLEAVTLDKDKRDIQHSMCPPRKAFGYTAHALMIPPFMPRNILLLGYAGGTVDFLINLIYMEPVFIDDKIVEFKAIKKDAVDILDSVQLLSDNTTYYKMDALEYVKTCDKVYDYVAVDLYVGNEIPKFVFEEEFIKNLNRITNRACAVNCTFYEFKDLHKYLDHFDVDAVKSVNEDKVVFLRPKKITVENKIEIV